MTVRRCLEVLRFLEVKVTDWWHGKYFHTAKRRTHTNHTRSEIPVVPDDVDKLFFRFCPCAIGINENG